MQLENYDLIAVTEMCWEDSHNWNTMIKGYELFESHRRGRRGRGVALYVKKWMDCKELPVRNSHKQVASLWVEVRSGSKKRQLVVGI